MDAERRRTVEVWLKESWNGALGWIEQFLLESGWVVVPVESGLHFDSGDCQRVAAAARTAGCNLLLAVTLEEDLVVEASREDHTDLPQFLEVEPVPADLATFSHELGAFNYMLVAEELSFAVACITEEYYLIAGPPLVVQAGVVGSIGDARRAFLKFARDNNSDEWTTLVHMRVADRYMDSHEA